MATWQIKGEINNAQYQGNWNTILAPGSAVLPNLNDTGNVLFVFGADGLYLDGSPTKTLLANLPAGFQIDTINRNTLGANGFETLPTVVAAGSPLTDTPITWNINLTGLSQADPNFTAPGGLRPRPNTWNGRLTGFVLQCQVYVSIAPIAAADVGKVPGFTIANYIMSGTYVIAPEPVNPDFRTSLYLDMSAIATFRILADASGIYTLQSGLRHDRLYQRTGPSAPQMNVSIPAFFKTGYIGGNGG